MLPAMPLPTRYQTVAGVDVDEPFTVLAVAEPQHAAPGVVDVDHEVAVELVARQQVAHRRSSASRSCPTTLSSENGRRRLANVARQVVGYCAPARDPADRAWPHCMVSGPSGSRILNGTGVGRLAVGRKRIEGRRPSVIGKRRCCRARRTRGATT